MRASKNNKLFAKADKSEMASAFAWKASSYNRTRMVCAFLLASGITILAALFLRVGVPSAFQPDAPFLAPVQIIPVSAKSDASLLQMLEKGRVPSLGSDEILLETPFLDDLLTQIDLSEKRSPQLRFLDAPEMTSERLWPREEGGELALPKAPAVELVPRSPAARPKGWTIHLKASGEADSTVLAVERVFPWEGELPLALQSDYTLVIAPDGGLALAFSDTEMETEIANRIRQFLQRWIGEVPENSIGGGQTLKAAVNFQPEGDVVP